MSVGERHDPDRELFGQGLANLVSPLFGGIPATAAIARTAVNVRAGAGPRAGRAHPRRRAAAIVLRRRAARRPDPAGRAGRRAARHRGPDGRGGAPAALARATRGDARRARPDLRRHRGAGPGHRRRGRASASRSCWRCARSPAAPGWNRCPLDAGEHSAEEHALLAEHIVAYRLDGPLFFAAAHRFLLELSEVADVRVVILRMSRVSTIDATGARCSATPSPGCAARHHRAALRHHAGPRPGSQRARRRRGPAPRRAWSSRTPRPPSATPGVSPSPRAPSRLRSLRVPACVRRRRSGSR